MSAALSGRPVRLQQPVCVIKKNKKKKEKGTSAVDLAGSSVTAGLIMIASFWAAQKADRHNIPFKRFLSALTGKLFNPLW